jgi:hypothetical protein
MKKIKLFAFLLLCSSVFSSELHAFTVCGTIPECRDQILKDQKEFLSLKVKLNLVPKVVSGKKGVTFFDGAKYCSSLGARFPTLREGALIMAQVGGGRGPNSPTGLDRIHTIEIANLLDLNSTKDYFGKKSTYSFSSHFFFDWEGFDVEKWRINSPYSVTYFWTSSMTSLYGKGYLYEPYIAGPESYLWDYTLKHFSKSGALCVKDSATIQGPDSAKYLALKMSIEANQKALEILKRNQPPPRLLPDERGPNGEYLLARQDDAAEYCHNKYILTKLGGHLPTSRELAKIFTADGAVGITELPTPHDPNKETGLWGPIEKQLEYTKYSAEYMLEDNFDPMLIYTNEFSLNGSGEKKELGFRYDSTGFKGTDMKDINRSIDRCNYVGGRFDFLPSCSKKVGRDILDMVWWTADSARINTGKMRVEHSDGGIYEVDSWTTGFTYKANGEFETQNPSVIARIRCVTGHL